MADTNDNVAEILQSVETDAAPSVEFVNLDNLNIGSECEVKTELKPGSKGRGSDIVDIREVDEDVQSYGATCTQSVVKEVDRNIETGLGSLNLQENVKPEVHAVDVDLKESLLLQDSDGDTMLHLAILLHRDFVLNWIDLMAEQFVPLDTPNRLSQTALHIAVLTGQNDTVKALLSTGASVFRRDYQLRTPMFVACEKNDQSTLEIFTEHTNWNMADHEATSRLLVPSINPLNLPNADGERCLHLAVRHNNKEMARKLIENGADPNLPDRRSGRTPLHVSADLGRAEMVEYLISLEETDINQRTYNEETALDIAHVRGRTDIVSLLKGCSFPVMKRKSKKDVSTG